MARKVYTPEFKATVIQQVKAGGDERDVATANGIDQATLRRWLLVDSGAVVVESQPDGGEAPANVTAPARRTRRLNVDNKVAPAAGDDLVATLKKQLAESQHANSVLQQRVAELAKSAVDAAEREMTLRMVAKLVGTV